VIESLPLLAFAFAGLFSPGPNVVMLTASGARFGFRKTLPHLLGVPIGVGLLAGLARAARAGRSADNDKPFTFLQAITFQVINPKVWAVVMAAAAGFGIGLSPAWEALRLAVVFLVLNTFVCLFWTSAGHLLSSLLASDKAWRSFMSVMALIMASTVVLIFI